jgi:phage terminase large subunit-like protein
MDVLMGTDAEFPTRPTRIKIIPGYVLFPFKSKHEIDYDGPVYDLTVRHGESFCIPGACVHNCNDDLENEKNYQTEGQRSDLMNSFMFQQSVLTKVKSKGIGLDIFVGTPYHFQGLTWKVRNDKSYSHLEIPCYVDRDKAKGVTFPERFTVDDFEDIRKKQSGSVFASQYLLFPLNEEDALCPESWLRYWDALPDPAWRTMVIDAGGTEGGKRDFTGITIVDTDINGNMYVVLAEEYHFSPMDFMNKIAQLKQDYNPDDIRVEKEKYTTTIADIFQHKFPLLNISFVEHKGRNKEQRIWRLQQWFQGKRIFVGRNQSAFRDQLTQYPSVNHDDMLDSLAYHLDIRRVPEPYQHHRLPSGKEFIPNIPEDFEEEMNRVLAGVKSVDQARENDHVW